jgi:hypothetical protein
MLQDDDEVLVVGTHEGGGDPVALVTGFLESFVELRFEIFQVRAWEFSDEDFHEVEGEVV